MFQSYVAANVFILQVVSVYLEVEVAYVTMAIHVCYKCMFQMFYLFQTYVSSVLFGCCICCSGYTHMLQAYVLNLLSVSDVCCSKCFMLQVFHDLARGAGAGTGSPRMHDTERARVVPTCIRMGSRAV